MQDPLIHTEHTNRIFSLIRQCVWTKNRMSQLIAEPIDDYAWCYLNVGIWLPFRYSSITAPFICVFTSSSNHLPIISHFTLNFNPQIRKQWICDGARWREWEEKKTTEMMMDDEPKTIRYIWKITKAKPRRIQKIKKENVKERETEKPAWGKREECDDRLWINLFVKCGVKEK